MTEIHLDALIVGAGFGGIYQLYSLLKLGVTCKVIDRAGDVGGTWYWNKYPGCMSDTESYLYRFSWDKEDLKNYPWPNSYVVRDEILAYLEHVVEKNQLRNYMQFNTELVSATWNDAGHWKVRCSTGDVFVVKYLFTAMGNLSRKNLPDIPGIDGVFKGELMHSSNWNDELDLSDKRVGVVGTGSTGIQITTALGGRAKELHCFIRSPQYSVPSGFHRVSDAERAKVNDNYDEIWSQARQSTTAFGFEEPSTPALSVSQEEREKVFEELWRLGNGFRFMFGGFGDITINPDANEEACKFIRKKISHIIRDPAKAAVLTPHDYYARRPTCDGGYYDRFNLDNVYAIDVKKTPIVSVEETGLKTADGKIHELDVIAFATGFDAVDGSYNAVRDGIIGTGGQRLSEYWKKSGPSTYLGTFVPGFPNLFVVNGPLGPFCNQPTALETMVDFTVDVLKEMRDRDADIVQVGLEAEAEWIKTCEHLSSFTLFDKVDSWITGANLPEGRQKHQTRFYYGGLGRYSGVLQDLKSSGYDSLKFSSTKPN